MNTPPSDKHPTKRIGTTPQPEGAEQVLIRTFTEGGKTVSPELKPEKTYLTADPFVTQSQINDAVAAIERLIAQARVDELEDLRPRVDWTVVKYIDKKIAKLEIQAQAQANKQELDK